MFVCLCHPLTEKQLIELIRSGKVSSLNQVLELTKAGTNCGSCITSLVEIYYKTLREQVEQAN